MKRMVLLLTLVGIVVLGWWIYEITTPPGEQRVVSNAVQAPAAQPEPRAQPVARAIPTTHPIAKDEQDYRVEFAYTSPPVAQKLTVEAAIFAIQSKLTTGDPRSPKLLDYAAFVPATAAEKKRSKDYEAYQQKLQEQVVASYLPTQADIERMDERLNTAERSGRFSSAQLLQAQEMLEKREELRALLLQEGVAAE